MNEIRSATYNNGNRSNQILRNFTIQTHIKQKCITTTTLLYRSQCFASRLTSGLKDNSNAVSQELKKLPNHKVAVSRYEYNKNNCSIISTHIATKRQPFKSRLNKISSAIIWMITKKPHTSTKEHANYRRARECAHCSKYLLNFFMCNMKK